MNVKYDASITMASLKLKKLIQPLPFFIVVPLRILYSLSYALSIEGESGEVPQDTIRATLILGASVR